MPRRKPEERDSSIEDRDDETIEDALASTARKLAGQHERVDTIMRRDTQRVFMERLQKQEKLLQRAVSWFARASQEEQPLSYAAEWLLDNTYLLQRTQRQVEEDFPAHYYAELPKLSDQDLLHGYPRIYAVAHHLVASDGCEIEPERIKQFLHAYQHVQPLRIGELWALPIMLRVVLLESIVQSALRLSQLADETPEPPAAFRVPHELRDEDVIATCVPGLHTIASQDWKQFFEDISRVDQILARDPAAMYTRCDFETRDRYRKAVEKLARRAGCQEITVAREAVSLARASRAETATDDSEWQELKPLRTAHAGYYLDDRGRRQLEQRLNVRLSITARLRRLTSDHPTFVYLGSVGLVTLLALFGVYHYLALTGATPLRTAFILLLVMVPAISVAVSLTNWLVTQIVTPQVLPKLDFSRGIPDQYCTMVVIPSLLTSRTEIQSLLHQLELHHLRNPDPNLSFALLTDFTDAGAETMPGDEALLSEAQEGIEALNRRYPSRFYLFHRRRLWNPLEGVWMGWERKRGKLHEFNRLLRGATDTTFFVQSGDLSSLSSIQYVITLDTDTILPRESAARLVGALAHPLNRAAIDPQTGKVLAGYTVLQPRTEVQPGRGKQSLFTRVFGGDTGLDLYTRAVSDVYQDLFGEGVYVGKGIYDVDAFERSLAGRVPQNALLSHDLFEGIHGRVGLVSDVILYEDFPSHYLLQVRRSHRWVRGDWQLLPWLLPLVPRVGPHGVSWVQNRLDVIDLWKIADNLRRSLLSPALVLLLITGWTTLPGSPLVWTLLALATPAVSVFTATAAAARRLVSAAAWEEIRRPLRDSTVRWLLFVAFLPYEAVFHVDAIVTTLWRLLVSRRNLLQWTTAAHTARLLGEDVSAEVTWRSMTSSLLIAASLALLVLWLNPSAFPMALPLLLLWSLSPQLAHLIGRPDSPIVEQLSRAQQARLRRLARRTWLFYERFVGPEDNWLPPDHFQESPKGTAAHRTSPTNVGLYLLSAIAAFDFGYVDPTALMLRLRSAFDALAQLDRYRGHFFNWIDTTTLAPLPPRYVSTVDSGNLAGCLLALRQALIALPQQSAWRWERWQGLLDTLDLLAETVQDAAPDEDERTGDELEEFLASLQSWHTRILAVQDNPRKWPALLDDVAHKWQPALERRLLALVESWADAIRAETLQECRFFLRQVHEYLRAIQRQLDLLLPWLPALNAPPSLLTKSDLDPQLAGAWQDVQTVFSALPDLRSIGDVAVHGNRALAELQTLLDDLEPDAAVKEATAWTVELGKRLESAQWMAQSLIAACVDISRQADMIVRNMDFSFLFNEQRQVFHIGYNFDAGKLDDNFYDLLASEARIASLVAIAKNDVPLSHWLHLARPITSVAGGRTLLSWSGTMFEYLMPSLLLHSYHATLLCDSMFNAIRQQMAYANEQAVPWGISESGFYTFDAAMNYQYRAFGVPGLGFKRGIGDDAVIAPYGSLLALPFRPAAVLDNLDHLDKLAMKGRYGYYEAIDFTDSHLELEETHAIVRSYMAHHQGMIMLALLNYLQNERMIERFHADPRIQSVELLLQEEMPYGAPLEKPPTGQEWESRPAPVEVLSHPWQVPWQTPMPAAHLLSNGSYSVIVTNSGAGYSRWQDVALTRWRPDATLDDWGQWLYVRDEDSGALWSAGLQPTGVRPAEGPELTFHPHMVQWWRRDHDVTLNVEVTVAPDDDVEIRRISLSNSSDRPRHLRLTSYGEVVLAPQAEDQRHPAFVKLFVESEYLPQHNALLFRRRPRAATEEPPFMAHSLLMQAGHEESGEHESDRGRFLGRNHTAQRPQALDGESWLSGTTGATLDPIMALGQHVELLPHSTIELALLTVAAGTREDVEALLARYRSWPMLGRTFELARGRAEQELHKLELEAPVLELAQRLLSLLLYPHPFRRAEEAALSANRTGQPGLWAYGISGDYPILALRVHDETDSEILQHVLRVHNYWHSRGLKIDLVIVNNEQTNYGQTLQGFIHRLIRRAGASPRLQQRGGIFVINADQIGDGDRYLLQTAARVLLDAAQGTLQQQLSAIYDFPTRLPALEATMVSEQEELPPIPRPQNLLFDNGFGGFSAGSDDEPAGNEYVIFLRPGQATPAPWINVIANPDFGFLVSESGSGCTWSLNSGENRLTTWRNDPVTDLPAEALYLRDEETTETWSPMPQPAPAGAPYLIRHGAGYTIFEHNSHGLNQEVRLFAATDAPVKVIQLRLENGSARQRRLTATYYAELVLGTGRETTQQYLIPEYAGDAHALLIRNPYNAEFTERVAFLAANKEPHGLTADRSEFLGRLGSLRSPAALGRVGLEDTVRAGPDTCAAIQLHVDLAPGTIETVYFLLGQGADRQEVLQLIARFQDETQVNAAWDATRQQWDNILGTVQVDTPDPAMNILLNRWLLYQALSCRLWGRSALYQSSGAYGFRDQLQDVLSLIHARPDLAREHIRRAAQHQFEAGDVLHWWHPPSGRGVRTRIKDDLLWLPFVTAHYVTATGDTAILEDKIPFLKGKPLPDETAERYGHYEQTRETYSLFEHCRRALEKGSTQGRHGLPLMGAGDWNDGMNRVGIEGQGESVWLGWFLHTTLCDFATLCQQIGNSQQADAYREQARAYQEALEDNAWDGAWYRRAYYDDGTPLGSQHSSECQIDAIAQSWAVLSGAADRARAETAMDAVARRLIDWDERLLLLFTPPFDESRKDPGYIKGYPPGIRENGGQYTHAALWTIWAFAELGEGEKAESLFRHLNPIYRAGSKAMAEKYKVEPYVISADVYSAPAHTGRGGWTWYTGSSGWMYRLGLEAILGLRREGNALRFKPRIPPHWPGYRLTYRFGDATYHVEVVNDGERAQQAPAVIMDGDPLADGLIPLRADSGQHNVQIRL